MKAAIALLSDFHVQNIVRRMVLEISRYAEIEFLGSLLPAHVSLKQPFLFESMDTLQEWFDSFSQRTPPMAIRLDHIYYEEWDGHAIMGLRVQETPALRELHNQINRELKEIVQDPSAPHDGDGYRFHLTIELGNKGSSNPFKRFYDALSDKQVSLSFRAEHIALFYYADREIKPGSFICSTVLPLSG